ncbi:MAG: hypothetical protein K940chlam7_00226 [Chlamydiae bacterium]|nr:hypothetical protein [Chlamydiota bacterium]
MLDDNNEFDRFTGQIAHPKEGYDIPEILAKEVIHILCQLKDKSPEKRIEYLNHTNVDTSLVFYMRHVAAEYMQKEYSIYSYQDIFDIKTNKGRGGATEISAFARYFNLELHLIDFNSEGKLIYRKMSRSDRGFREPVSV